jgi:hypothetical protein
MTLSVVAVSESYSALGIVDTSSRLRGKKCSGSNYPGPTAPRVVDDRFREGTSMRRLAALGPIAAARSMVVLTIIREIEIVDVSCYICTMPRS